MASAPARRWTRCSRREPATSSCRPGRKRTSLGRCRRARAWSCCTGSGRRMSRRRWPQTPGRRSTPPSRSRGGRKSRRTRPCDVMIDTGMNRLGLRPEEIGSLEGLAIDTLMSHLACADEDHPLNAKQLERFREVAAAVPAKRYSLANSAGICLGRDYAFDLVRPGLALTAAFRGAKPRATSARSRMSKPKSSSAGRSAPAKAAAMARPLSPRRTPKRRSSTSVTPTAICAAFRRVAARLPANSRCRSWVACRWI